RECRRCRRRTAYPSRHAARCARCPHRIPTCCNSRIRPTSPATATDNPCAETTDRRRGGWSEIRTCGWLLGRGGMLAEQPALCQRSCHARELHCADERKTNLQ